MERRQSLRESRLVHMTVGATMLAVPASAAALAGNTPAHGQQAAAQSPIQAKMRARRLAYGRNLVVTGHAPSYAGQQLALQYAPARSTEWRSLRTTTVRPDGSFRLVARLTRSGQVRVSGGSPSSSTPTSPTTPVAIAASSSGSTATTPQRVAVDASLRVPNRAINVLGSEVVNLRGRLLPGSAHRRVALQTLRAGRWVTLAVARTGARGGFRLRYAAAGLGQRRLRVRFAGDGANAAASHGAGTVTVYRSSMASWYDDGGNTACGFHAYYGVANVSLPCGSRVSFTYGGRTVNAVVDDRGPYVGGRSWDLNQNTAGALGFSGVQTVWSSS
ncbi:MAG TPA: septal ring lytic transglycosylase RlpA family protein [Solirubrobacteraceae bacterium]|nr:septal ring lytic transglycosylase RlpA family protein [Solirubrobacteraceae bacterium]